MQYYLNNVFLLILSYLAIGSSLVQSNNAEPTPQDLALSPGYTKVKKIINGSYRVTCLSSQPNNTFWVNPHGRKIVDSPDSSSSIRVEVHAYGVDLHLIKISPQQEGAYKCVLLNGSGSRAAFDLDVIYPIVFDQTLQRQVASEGKPYLMKCAVHGIASPRLYWSVDGRIPDKHKYRITRDGFGLEIFNVTEADAEKLFTCREVNSDSIVSQSKMFNMSLRIRSEPRPIQGGNVEMKSYGINGQWVNLTCSVKAEPPATFEWLYQTRSLENSRDIQITNEENQSTLRVLIDNEGKYGDYACRAMNEFGHTVQTFVLLKGEKPLKPILTILSVTTDEVQISTKHHGVDQIIGSRFPILGYKIQYKPHCRMATRNSENDWILANGNSKTMENQEGFILTKLSHGTTYCIRAALRNEGMVGYFSSPVKVAIPLAHTDAAEQAQNQISGTDRTQQSVLQILIVMLVICLPLPQI